MSGLTRCLAALALAAAATPAVAGEQYVDANDFALSGYDVTSYFEIEQGPVGGTNPAPVPGNAAITADWNGATWAFATAANRDRFLTDPTRFAPQYDGHCALAVAKGAKVPGNPTLWRIVDDKLHVNINDQAYVFWQQDIAGNLSSSETNWPGLEPRPASADPVPGFTSPAPVTN